MDTSDEGATGAGLEAFVRSLYDALDRRDFERFRAMLADDYQQIDERTGVWFRGGPDPLVEGHKAEIEAAERYSQRLEDLDSRLVADDVGVVTFVWSADARWDGTDYHLRCPTTLVARWTAAGWRAVVIHSVQADDRSGNAEIG
jgi:ketosteroid isomerase-like protein